MGRFRLGLRSIGIVMIASLVIPAGMPAVCAAAATAPKFIAPVDGEIGRHFERPLGPYAEGHRGIDFMVEEGTEVVASADGEVSFAGPVGDGLYITIDHGGGLETTYSFLSEILVSTGDVVSQGDVIALSGPGHEGEEPSLHFGARFHGIYLDPEILLFGDLEDISRALSLAPLDEDAFPNDPVAGGGSSALQPIDLPESKAGFFVSLGQRLGQAGNWFAKLGSAAWGWLSDAWSSTASGAAAAGRGFWSLLGSAWGGVTSAWDFLSERVGTGVRNGLGWMSWAKAVTGSAIGSIWDWMRSSASTAWDWLVRGWNGALAALDKAWSWIKMWIADDWEDTKEFVSLLGQWTAKAIRATTDGLTWAAHEVVQLLEAGAKALYRAARWIGRGLLSGAEWLWDTVRKTAAARFVGSILRAVDSLAFLPHLIPAAIEQVKCSRDADPPPDLPTTQELDAGEKPPPPPNDNILVAVAGIGSQTAFEDDGTVQTNATIYELDFRTLGYEEDQLYFYSYAGLGEGGEGPYRLHAPYTKEDSQQSIRDAALKLARQIKRIREQNPNREIDLIAHSQGGLVAQYYVTRFRDLEATEGDVVDHLVTLGSPHQGAELAQVSDLWGTSLRGATSAEILTAVAQRVGLPPPLSESVMEMSPDSRFMDEIRGGWKPDAVSTTTISAFNDVVVPSPRSRLPGASNYTIGLDGSAGLWGHEGVVTSAQSAALIYGSLADHNLECSAWANAIADHSVGQGIAALETLIVSGIGIISTP